MALFITAIFRLYGSFVGIRMVPLLKEKIAGRAFDALLNQSHSYFINNFPGDLTHKVNNPVDSTIELIKLSIDHFFCLYLSISFCYLYFIVSKHKICYRYFNLGKYFYISFNFIFSKTK